MELSMMQQKIEEQAALIKRLERLVYDVHNCLIEKMPSVALQTLQLSNLSKAT
jgi:hypothetical protein